MSVPAPPSSPSWAELLSALIAGRDLSAGDTGWAMDEVMSGAASPAQVAAFVVALRAKGETGEEVDGLATAMLAHARRVQVPGRAVDVVGTGGDRASTVNISTMSAVVVAAAGATVIKHGNRAASSRCGAADLLEELGVAIDLPPESVQRCVEKVGIGFCFAPVYHPAMRHAAVARREIGVPTVFNFLGPLTNPAQPAAALVGCADVRMVPVMAAVFAARGATVLLVRGDDGLDEITTTTTTTALLVDGGVAREVRIDPTDLDLPPARPADLRGGVAGENAEITRRLLAGEPGPVRDAVLLNAAAALAAHTGFSPDLVSDLAAGYLRAADAVDSGAAAALLTRWAELSTSLRPG